MRTGVLNEKELIAFPQTVLLPQQKPDQPRGRKAHAHGRGIDFDFLNPDELIGVVKGSFAAREVPR